MADCIFCMLAGGQIPTATLYEDDDFRVILDASPATKGHCLVLPKAHYEDALAMPDELLAKAHVTAKTVAARLMKAMNCDGINIVQNNKPAAGQTVFHFHIHIIPRYEGGEAIVGWDPGELTEENKVDILKRFAEA
ncbi:MAG: HIT family protein [Lachnospiraceae bacterium]|nr:HIT family protein [Lachnospiraceae bacterium]